MVTKIVFIFILILFLNFGSTALGSDMSKHIGKGQKHGAHGYSRHKGPPENIPEHIKERIASCGEDFLPLGKM